MTVSHSEIEALEMIRQGLQKHAGLNKDKMSTILGIYPGADTTSHSFYIRSIQTLSALAGQQTSATFPAKDGCTNTLGAVLIELRKVFDLLDDTTKDTLGLKGKSATEITHFDLLEIGLYGKVSTHDKTSGQILLRNDNLRKLYLEEHVAHYSQLRGSLIILIANTATNPKATDASKIETMIDNQTISLANPENLYTYAITVTSKRAIDTHTIWDRKISCIKTDTNDLFLTKMQNALARYEKESGNFWHATASKNTKKMCEEIKKILSTAAANCDEEIVTLLSQHTETMDSHLKNILRETGIMTIKGEMAVSPNKASQVSDTAQKQVT